MKKVWEVIKKIFVWLGAVFVAIFTVLFIKEREVVSTGSTTSEEDADETNRRAAQKRDEAIARIERAEKPLKKSLSLLFYPYLVLLYSKTIEKEH